MAVMLGNRVMLSAFALVEQMLGVLSWIPNLCLCEIEAICQVYVHGMENE